MCSITRAAHVDWSALQVRIENSTASSSVVSSKTGKRVTVEIVQGDGHSALLIIQLGSYEVTEVATDSSQ